MEFAELVKTRRSVRKYTDEPVSDEHLTEICEAGRWAPSALNMQPWEFIVVTDTDVRGKIADNARAVGVSWPQIRQAAAVIVLCARKTSEYARDDCLLAAQNMMLQATDLGLGTCYIGGFSPERIRQLLSIPKGYIVPGMITVGHPEKEPDPPEKRELQEIVHHDTFEGRGVGLTGYRRALALLWKFITGRGNK
ncbi:MAG: nitroreductase family protein [Armatimonadota bacterium]